MHSAPSVSYPVGRSRYAARLLTAVWSVGACCAGLACAQLDGFGWRCGLLIASAALAGFATFASLLRVRSGELAFDGQRWSLSSIGARPIAAVGVVLDLQVLLLVRLDAARGAATWLWLERPAQPAAWQDLRRALHARPPSAADGALPVVP